MINYHKSYMMHEKDKITVAWICYFSNEKIRSLYPGEVSRPIYKFARHILNLPQKTGVVSDFAPWVNIGIDEMSKRPNVELHVIAPIIDLKVSKYEFESDGVHYHFFRSDWTQLIRHIIRNPKLWLCLQNNSHIINCFLDEISPDVINLVGTENAYYSCSVLNNNHKAPIFVSLQTVYSNPARLKYMPDIDKSINWYIDKRILSECMYFGVEDKMYNDLIKHYNPSAITLNFSFCVPPYPSIIGNISKEYDFVNFAMQHSEKKGTPDSIIAMSEVVKKYPRAKLNIVGGCEQAVKHKLEKLITAYHLEDNIVFTPYFTKHTDLLEHIQKARMAVLPIKLDVIPGTVLQAMHYKLPVITYSTTGTPYINKRKNRVLLCKENNPSELALQMVWAIEHPTEIETMSNDAKDWINRFIDNNKRTQRLIDAYHAIISHYQSGTPIENSLLFDEDKVVYDEDNF